MDIPESLLKWMKDSSDSCGESLCKCDPPCDAICSMCNLELDDDATTIPVSPESKASLEDQWGLEEDEAEFVEWICSACYRLMTEINNESQDS